MNSHHYLTVGFLAAAISFLPLRAFPQASSQPSASATPETLTVKEYISLEREDHEAGSHYLIHLLNDILTDLDSPTNSDGTRRTDIQIKNNGKLSRFIDRWFTDAAGASHYQELAGFLEQFNKNGKGEDTVETAIYTYISDTLEEAKKAANSNPDSAAKKPR